MASKSTPATTDFDGNTDVSNLSYDELEKLFASGEIADITDIEDRKLYPKESLVGVPFIIKSWKFHTGGMGEYVVVEIATQMGGGVFADGSTGIRDQLDRYEAKLGGVVPIRVSKGLRASNYQVTTDDGKTIDATTFYLATDA